jgi:ubiquinone/menaquinone biosynthesis C-methylase UbiE
MDLTQDTRLTPSRFLAQFRVEGEPVSNDIWKTLYAERAEEYDRFVQHEDHEGNLLAALNEIHPLENADVIDFGAGTGRITLHLIPLVNSVRAFDVTPSMIRIAHQKLSRSPRSNWLAGVADSRAMPLPANCADVAVEGWSFVQIAAWHPDAWRKEVDRAVSEMFRVVRPSGAVILIETMGTGTAEPDPPEPHLPLHDHLTREWGFSATWIRTDYFWPSMAEARDAIAPVFGDAVLETATESAKGVVLPECTGIWHRKKEAYAA